MVLVRIRQCTVLWCLPPLYLLFLVMNRRWRITVTERSTIKNSHWAINNQQNKFRVQWVLVLDGGCAGHGGQVHVLQVPHSIQGTTMVKYRTGSVVSILNKPNINLCRVCLTFFKIFFRCLFQASIFLPYLNLWLLLTQNLKTILYFRSF